MSSGHTEHVADEVVYKELDDSLVRAATTASSLEAEHDNEFLLSRQQRPLKSNEIDSLKRRVKRLEKNKRSRTHRLKRLYKVGLSARVESSRDEEYLGDDASKQGMINAILLDRRHYPVTLAQALAALKSVKPKVKANVVEEPSVPVSAASTKVSAATTTTTSIIPTPSKGIVHYELDTIYNNTIFLHTLRKSLGQSKEYRGETYKGEDDANVALTEEWDDIQAKVEADYQKHFAAKRAEEKRNKPPTQAQQRKIMCTYLKNMEGKKPKDLKNKSFDSIKKMFDRAFKWVNTFVDFRTDLVDGSSKRAGDEVEQEVTKKQKVDDVQEIAEVDDDQETTQIKELMKIKLVKAKYGTTRPVEDLDLILYGDLKTMFEPHVEDQVWKNQQDYRVLDWKLYDSCGVHCLRMQHIHIHMLVEKGYPITPATITDMLNKKLQYKYQVYGRIVGIKRLLDDLRVIAAQVCVTAVKLKICLCTQDLAKKIWIKISAYMVAASKVPILKPEVKARSTLMMGIPNEHQLLEAIEKKFGGNDATKKTQRNLLKQQYENFTTPSSEMLDQT
ncbi:hypothetical protein Tco_1223555, partial [Tanacetum coccineum]